MSLLTKLTHAAMVGRLPDVLPVPDRHPVTGMGPPVDRAAELLPPDLRSKLIQIIQQKKLRMAKMPEDTAAQYRPWFGRIEIPASFVERASNSPYDAAKTLAHEVQHSMQKKKPTIPTPLRPLGDEYMDDPYEVDARRTAYRVARPVQGGQVEGDGIGPMQQMLVQRLVKRFVNK